MQASAVVLCERHAREPNGGSSNTLEGFETTDPSQPIVVVDGGHSGRKALSSSGMYGKQFFGRIGCGDQSGVAAKNRFLSAWAFVDADEPLSVPGAYCGVNYSDATGRRTGATVRPAPLQQWFQITTVIETATVNEIEVYCFDDNFLGKRFLIDDVSIK